MRNFIIYSVIAIVIVCFASKLKNKVEQNVDSKIAVYQELLND